MPNVTIAFIDHITPNEQIVLMTHIHTETIKDPQQINFQTTGIYRWQSPFFIEKGV